MYYFCVHTYAEMASFRIPETHTFQQTLPLPPVTTLIGILGAAAGLSFQQAMEYYENNHLRFGVIGTHSGRVKDLWKYHKVKSGEVLSAVLLREYVIDLDMYVYITAEKEEIIKTVKGYFLDPYYALTAGNSDDLLKIKSISQVLAAKNELLSDFSNTVITGDHADNYESNIDIKEVPLMRDIYVPMVHLLPVEFEFSGEERRVKKRQAFTFVDTAIKLKEPVLGLKTDGKVVPLL
jgi:CRISPR-associated protein Cas5t